MNPDSNTMQGSSGINRGERGYRKRTVSISDLLIHFCLVLGAALMIFPFLWTLTSSLKSIMEMFSYPPKLLPEIYMFSNYVKSITAMPFGKAYWNSFFVTASIVIIQLLTCSMAAYAFAKIRFPGREALFMLFLAMLMVPHQVTMIPMYLIMGKLNWLDTYWALIVPNAVFWAFGIFLLRQFMKGIPDELEEAAMVDGASPVRSYLQIMLPLVRPALAALTIFSFLANWNAFLYPLLYMSSRDKFTVPLLLNAFKGQHVTDWSLIMAGTMISIVPVLIVYLIAQKQFIEGIALTGIKG